MRLKRSLVVFSAILAMGFVASADSVVMKNGDHLTGIVEVSDGKNVTLKTDYAGEIQIAWASISEIKSDKPIYVVLPDKSLIDMTRRRPATLAEMAEVHGIGEAKLKRYAAEFLEVIRQHQEGE